MKKSLRVIGALIVSLAVAVGVVSITPDTKAEAKDMGDPPLPPKK